MGRNLTRAGGVVAAVAALAVIVVAVGCGSSADDDATLTVYVSAPLQGPRADAGHDVADGARLALADADGKAGGVAIDLEVLSDATGGGWDAAATGANARAATEDTTTIAYVGELDSGASRTSIPITNRAGILQVSPGAGAADLTSDSPASGDAPAVQESGHRTFGRVIPSDRDQGEAAGVWMADSGISSVLVDSDGSAYADSLVDGLDAAPSPPEVVTGRDPADAVYIAAEGPVRPAGAGTGDRGILGSDAQLDDPRALGSNSTPVRLTSAALDPTQLPPAADDFLAAFEAAYDRMPGRYAAYGYEAMAVVLDSVGRADDPTDRGDVVDAFFDTGDRESILGTYSIDGVGDTTLRRLGAYRIDGRGRALPEREALTIP